MPQEESLSVRFIGDNKSLEKASQEAAKSLDKVGGAADSSNKALGSLSTASQKTAQAVQVIAKSAISAGGSLTVVGNEVSSTFAKVTSDVGKIGPAVQSGIAGVVAGFDTLNKAALDSSNNIAKSSVVSEKASQVAQQMANNAAKAGGALASAGDEVVRVFSKMGAVDPSGKLNKTLGSLQLQLKRLEKGLKDVDNAASFNRITRAISETKRRIDVLQSSQGKLGQAFDKTTRSSGAATQSLVNLSRVAQDAPFGILGIANNLNPLLESFQRLQVEAKATGTSLSSALKGALLGPAGIGLALGVVSSLLITFGDKLFNTKSAAEKTAEAIKKASQMLRDYEDSLSDTQRVNLLGTQNAQSELTSLSTLYNAALNINIPLEKRKKIVDELQKQYPQTFANFKDETILAGGAATAYQNLTQQILASAKARAGQERIVELKKDELTFDERITNNQAERVALERQFVKERGKENKVRQTVDDLGNIVQTTTKADGLNLQINKKLEEGNKLLEERFQVQKRINALTTLLGDIVEKTPDSLIKDPGAIKAATSKKGEFNFFDKFFDFDFNGKLSSKQTSSLLDAANAFAKEFGGILEGLDFQNETQPVAFDAAKKFWANYRNGILKFKPQKLIDDITVEAPAIKLADGSNQIEDLLQGIQQGFDKVNPNNVGVLPDALERQRIITLAKFTKLYRDIGLELPKIIKTELENGLSKDVKLEDIPTLDLSGVLTTNLNEVTGVARAIEGAMVEMGTRIGTALGDAIGTALTGGNVAEVFKGLFGSLGEVVSALGQQIIRLGVLALTAQKAITALLKNPAAAIAVGVALTALGSAIKNTKPKGFAAGGLVYGPALGLVGEGKGTNRHNPEVISPLDKLSQYLGGSGETMIVGRLRGQDIELQRSRVGRRQRRLA
jgi:hypothetical protein